MERRDSKKTGNKQKQKDVKPKVEENEDERKRKGSGVSKSKPCREIYRPPSVRKGRGGVMESNGEYVGVATSGTGSPNHAQSAPLRTSSRPFNVYAKEFQYSPRGNPVAFSRSQSIAYYSNSTTDYYQNPILASSGCYPLVQSKSSGNLNNFYQLWAQQHQQSIPPQQQVPQPPIQIMKRRNQNSLSETTPPLLEADESQYYHLQQSKSSGNIPSRVQRNGKTVRFDFQECGEAHIGDEEPRSQAASLESRFFNMHRELEMTEKSLENLRINGHGSKGSTSALPKIFPSPNRESQEMFHNPGLPLKFSNPPPQLQKSYTFFGLPSAASSATKTEPAKVNSMIKRSKSYTSRSTSNSYFLSSPISLANISAASDFDINKWPKAIQESITTAVVGADRVPARHRINMVGAIFETLLSATSPLLESNKIEEEPEKQDSTEKEDAQVKETNPKRGHLVASAVNIFLYFIQREKDRAVMETVLNTCFATYQQIQRMSLKNFEAFQNSPEHRNEAALAMNTENNGKLLVFLQFLSTMFAKVKVIRLQQSQQSGMKSVDEMNNAILSLMCDTCLMTLRSQLFHTFEIMDSLFTVMTSIGREMEGTFPLKMKQILAAVRDALLGIKPNVVGMEISSPCVQKTLMQLIELHAANWHLPASAVRYYYSNPS